MAAPLARADLGDAEAAYRRGEREAAGELVRAYVREFPESARSPQVAAMLARTAHDAAEAMARWDEVIALAPTGPLAAEAHWTKGLHAYSAGLYVSAAEEFTLLGRDFSEEFPVARALLWRGHAELGADRPRLAYESYEEALQAAEDPEDARAAEFGLAHASYRLGNVKEALRRYRRFEHDHADDGRASAAARRITECLRLLGHEMEAAANAARIERDYPASLEATLARAEIGASEPSAGPAVPAGPQESPTGPFLVQVAAMSDPRNAADLRREILLLGITEIQVEPGDGPEGPVHRVLLGPYEDEATARAVADSVSTLGRLNPRLVRVRERGHDSVPRSGGRR
jgi:tetratricopeptide (TPR) repeat protein